LNTLYKTKLCGIATALAIFGSLVGAASGDDLTLDRAGWRDRDHLFGDWGGVRPRLEQHGVGLELLYTAEYFSNERGGIKRGGAYRADMSLSVEVDTGAAGWWENGEFFLHVQGQHGDGITEDYVGDFQVLSNIDADDYFQISEIWYKHFFLDRRLSLKIGKIESNADFAFVDYGGEFINSSAGFSPTIPLVTYPDQDWGLVVGVEPVAWFSMNVGLFQGDPDGGRSLGATRDHLRGPMVMIEPAFHYEIKGRAGHLRLGSWWNGSEFDRLGLSEEEPTLFDQLADELARFEQLAEGRTQLGRIEPEPEPRTRDEAYGFYVTWDQELYREKNGGEQSDQGLGVFAQYGWSDDRVMEASQYFGLGFQWTGPVRGRDADVLGLGVFHVELSDEADFEKANETVVELFYRAQIAPWFSIKPDAQYIANPGGSRRDDALALGARVELSF
jgi:porin